MDLDFVVHSNRVTDEGKFYIKIVRLLTNHYFNKFFSGYSYAKEYYKEGGYLCPSDIFYGRPKRAANTYGKWKVIVNLPDEYYAKGKKNVIVI